MKNPQVGSNFNEYVLHGRKDQAIGWGVYMVEQETQGWNQDATVVVGIGDNVGHQCAEFKKKFPKAPGHAVLQDFPGPIEMALSTPGVENVAHDMFKPQPIKVIIIPTLLSRLSSTQMHPRSIYISITKAPLVHAQGPNLTISEPSSTTRPTTNTARFSKTSSHPWVPIPSSILLDELVPAGTHGCTGSPPPIELTMMPAFASRERDAHAVGRQCSQQSD